MKLPTFAPDKLGHYLWGSIASVGGVIGAWQFGLPLWAGAVAAATLVGLIKDLAIDLILARGTFDPRDIVATIAGAIPAAATALV